jgi:hypothetical protein
MSEVLRTAWSIARSGWRSSFNRSFRFSRMKTAVIALAVQALFFVFMARRAPAMAAGTARDGLGGVMALVALQMAWFGLMYGFSRGQMQLYQGILVPLFQITPARPLAFLVGMVIEAVPSRAWSCLLWAWVYSGAVGGLSRWSVALLLAVVGLAAGMVAHLSGLLLLTFWSRYSPKTMRNGTIIFGVITMAMITWAAIYLSEGGSVTELALLMRQYRMATYTGVVALAGIPGLLLLGALAVRPVSVENLYRQGVYQVIELGDAEVAKPSRSVWLPLRSSVMRAVLSREWLELFRSKVARIQGLIWAAGTVGVYFAGQAMRGQTMGRTVQFLAGLSLLTWFMSYGHWVVRVFEKERKTMLLYRLTAVPAYRLILAKFTSVFVPSAVLVALSASVGAWAARVSFGQGLGVLAWSLGALAAGTLGGFGMAAATAGESDDQEMDQAPRREGEPPQATGNAWWAVARTVALLLTAALPVWTGAGQPGLPFRIPAVPLLAVDTVLPVALLVAGYWMMVRVWEASGTA